MFNDKLAAQTSARESWAPQLAQEVFVAVSRFVVANGMEDQVHQAFLERPHRVDESEGFVSMEVLRGLDEPREFWLVTHWRDEACFQRWHKGHAFHDSHRGIPRGLKLQVGAQVVRAMRSISR